PCTVQTLHRHSVRLPAIIRRHTYLQLPDPRPLDRDHRVSDHRRYLRRTRLPDAALRIGARYDMDLHHRHLGETEHAVVVEVALLDATLVDRDFAPQCGREAVHDGALHLRFDDVGVDDGPAVHRADDPVHARRSVGPHGDL